MENLTLGEIAKTLAFIVALLGSITYLKKTTISGITTVIDEKLEPIKKEVSDLKEQGKIKEEDIDKSVARIIRTKEKYNISDKKKINGCNIEELNKQIEELNSILN